jgi:hypothetical protein
MALEGLLFLGSDNLIIRMISGINIWIYGKFEERGIILNLG